MATLLISSWVVTSMVFCLALLRAAARRRPLIDDAFAAEDTAMPERGIREVLGHAEAIPQAASGMLH
jgi:hypothetical protein